ncbi:MAG: 1-(5-phosphoribosyl)-5-[(5-phosphoribosylamino)methylideneamino]imidazole-4-carboxamide isomerase [Pseudomonadota bacterium]
MIVIPAIDLYQNRVVRLFQGRYDEVTYYEHSPLELAQSYRDAGAKLIHIVDLDGAKLEGNNHHQIVKQICEVSDLEVQSGGGVRDAAQLEAQFDRGVARVVIGSLAVNKPDLVRSWIRRFGGHRFTLALDVRMDTADVPRIATHGWQKQSSVSLWDSLEFFGEELTHVLCTDIARDGALTGPSFALYRECITRYPHLRLQASGGVRNVQDISELETTGVAGAITGKALLEGKLKLQEIQPFLRNE